MVHVETWDYRPAWLEWVREVWVPGGRVQLQRNAHPARLAFANAAAESFRRRDIPVKTIKTWVSVQVPEDGEGYAHGYPHTHEPLDGVTLVHYLEPGDVPAPLDIFEGEEVKETIYPERGLTVFMPNHVKHGARKNHGTKDRIQVIATALPR